MDASLPQTRTPSHPLTPLQGLRLLPTGLLVLLLGLQRLGLPFLEWKKDLTISVPLLALVILLWIAVARCTGRRFGPLLTARAYPFRSVLTPLIALILALALEVALVRLHVFLQVSLVALAVAGLYLWSWQAGGGWYHLSAGVAMLAVAVLPFFMRAPAWSPKYGTFGLFFDAVFAACVLLVSWFDHLRLVRSLPARS